MRRIDQSVSLVQLQPGEGPCSPGTGRQRSSCCNSRILHTGTTQHRPNAPFRSDMAAAWAPFPPSLDPLGPNFGSRANVADSMRRAENIHFWLLLPTFFALHGGSCKVMLPRLGVSGPPTQDQVAHVKPNLRPNGVQTCASCAMLDPSCWSQMPSSAQARLSQLWLGQVGLLLSPLSYSLGASRSDSKINMVDSQFLTDFAA